MTILYTPFEQKCLELVTVSKSPHRFCFLNAIHHLEKAWALKDLDVEMSLFRCITAEEEAAAGLMRLLQDKGYAKSELLQPKMHPHKIAVVPFVSVIWEQIKHLLRQMRQSPIVRICPIDGVEVLTAVFPKMFEIAGEVLDISSPSPLNMSLTSEGAPLSFRSALANVLKTAEKNIFAKMRKRGNVRNGLLYASATGYPSASGSVPDRVILKNKRQVFAVLYAYLLIEPHALMPFVTDVVGDFTMMMARVQDAPETSDQLSKDGAVSSSTRIGESAVTHDSTGR